MTARQSKDHGALSLFGDGLRVDLMTGLERDSDPIDVQMTVRLHSNCRLVQAALRQGVLPGLAV